MLKILRKKARFFMVFGVSLRLLPKYHHNYSLVLFGVESVARLLQLISMFHFRNYIFQFTRLHLS